VIAMQIVVAVARMSLSKVTIAVSLSSIGFNNENKGIVFGTS
jgi:hypothetical protein